MRPIRLKLEGFTSFPKPVDIPFDALDLFAITGPTGAGKTSILDAVLYALFGRTPRIGEREIQRLISMGSTTARVSLEFLSNSERYRITRSFKKTTTILLEHHTQGDWLSISGKVGEVNEKLSTILGLDFTGFTRSVMLPQGEFDEFLRGDPNKRNQILIDLLNLHGYERMKQAANAKAKEFAIEREYLEKQLAGYTGATEEAIEAARKQLDNLRDELTQYQQVEQRLIGLAPKAEQRDALRKQAAEIERELKAQQLLTPADCDKRIAEIEDQIAALGYDEAVYLEFAQAIHPARAKAEAERILKTKAGAAISFQHARKSREEAAEKLQSFRQTHGSTDLIRSRLNELQDALTALAPYQPDGDRILTALETARDTLEQLRTQHAAAELRRHLHDGDTCPVCEQVIPKLPTATPNAELEQARDAFNKAEARARSYQRAAEALATAQQRANAQSPETLQDLIQQSQTLEAEAQRSAEVDTLALRVEDARKSLENFPSCARLPVAAIEATLTQQQEARKGKQSLEAALETARQQRNLAATHAAKAILLDDYRSRIAALEQELAGTQEIPLLLEQARRVIETLHKSIAQTNQKIEAIAKDIEHARQIRDDVQRKQQSEATYKTLGQLLKSDEFIAYVQREALTHLAIAASEQLHQLSEGRYTLSLAIDNDFAVIDNWNAGEPRSVKTLSGGESFLASLSLALALSQGLADFAAESARSRLDSLFIDEGISSLDPDSLETAISALTALAASGGRMVGVISHLSELAERLPGAIRIEKSPGGSRVILRSQKSSAVYG